MNQNINLYLPEFRKQQIWLNSGQMLRGFGIIMFILALVSAWQLRLHKEREALLIEAEAESAQLANDVAALETELTNVAGIGTLEAELEQLQAQVREKGVLLDFLEGRELGNVTGFSEFLADLSRYHTAGLSLTDIVLRGGGVQVELTGHVLQAELVPLYLQSLRQSRLFSGRTFQTLTIGEQSQTASDSTSTAASARFWEFEVATAKGVVSSETP